MMANSLRHQEERAASARRAVAAASAAPAPAKATLAPLGASGTKKPPPVAVAKCTWLTKRPYKHRKKTLQPAAVPAPTAAHEPASLVGVDGAAMGTPAEKKPPNRQTTSLVGVDRAAARTPAEMKPLTIVVPLVPAAASVPLLLDEPIHPCGILIEILGTAVSCQGRLCW